MTRCSVKLAQEARTFLALLGLLVGVSVKTTVAQTTDCWSFQGNTSSIAVATPIITYTKFDVPTLDDCKLACWSTATGMCYSIDWNPSFPNNSSCWLYSFDAATSSSSSIQSISHYILNRTCATSRYGCWSRAQVSFQVLDGQYVSTANKVWSCQAECYKDNKCTGIDFNNQSMCYLIRGGAAQPMDGVTHFDLNRNQIPVCYDYFSVPPFIPGSVSILTSTAAPPTTPSTTTLAVPTTPTSVVVPTSTPLTSPVTNRTAPQSKSAAPPTTSIGVMKQLMFLNMILCLLQRSRL